MALTAATVAGVAAYGGKELFDYNRESFKFDNEQRFKKELKVMDFRFAKAALWREDVRQLLDLTGRRMDSYLIVSALQLDICAGLMCEGRMEPGTPPWLINFYMLTLAGAFMYLFMSIWLATHASVVAQCCSVRLLTQFVRLPIPIWDHFEAARAYGADFEQQRKRDIMRVPFIMKQRRAAGDGRPTAAPNARAASSSAAATDEEQDAEGDRIALSQKISAQLPENEPEWHRHEIYELTREDVEHRHHVGLVRQATRYYQCFDAFARISMLFGTNQLLSALGYFAIGYCGVQDRSLTGSWCIGIIGVGIAFVITELDVAMTRFHRSIALALTLTGPVCVTCGTYAYMMLSMRFPKLVRVGYLSHALWLIFALFKIGVTEQGNGSLLPMNFRPLQLVDVFHWLSYPKRRKRGRQQRHKQVDKDTHTYQSASTTDDDELKSQRRAAIARARSDVAVLQSERVHEYSGAEDLSRVKALASDSAALPEDSPSSDFQECKGNATSGKPKIIKIRDYSDHGTEMACYVDPESGEVMGDSKTSHRRRDVRSITAAEGNLRSLRRSPTKLEKRRAAAKRKKGGICRWLNLLNEEVEPFSWDALEEQHNDSEDSFEDDVCEQNDHFDFSATFPHEMHRDPILNTPGQFNPGTIPWHLFCQATMLLVSLWVCSAFLPLELYSGFAWGAPSAFEAAADLGDGIRVPTIWPKHAGFKPRALSCDANCQRLVVADDFGVYVSEPSAVAAMPVASNVSRDVVENERRFERGFQFPVFGVFPSNFSGDVAEDARTFQRVKICKELEGQNRMDADVVCPGEDDCRILVLHRDQITACPFYVPNKTHHSGMANDGAQEAAKTWVISQEWLLEDDGEKIEAVASSGACFRSPTFLAEAFNVENTGCLIVGTSLGRIVQLRPHLTKEHHLVPEFALKGTNKKQVPNSATDPAADTSVVVPSGKMALHDFEERFFLALEPDRGILQALHVKGGDVAGSWRLPLGKTWLALSGGGGSVYLLGQEAPTDPPELWRFPVPLEVSSPTRRLAEKDDLAALSDSMTVGADGARHVIFS